MCATQHCTEACVCCTDHYNDSVFCGRNFLVPHWRHKSIMTKVHGVQCCLHTQCSRLRGNEYEKCTFEMWPILYQTLFYYFFLCMSDADGGHKVTSGEPVVIPGLTLVTNCLPLDYNLVQCPSPDKGLSLYDKAWRHSIWDLNEWPTTGKDGGLQAGEIDHQNKSWTCLCDIIVNLVLTVIRCCCPSWERVNCYSYRWTFCWS